ncbi:hypothetical protein F4777DRAFT_322575 [Nemania sp. FL0916]|nr:hypothetical protein F4777DRAFT_322575 [Nemania sp. FL0916]
MRRASVLFIILQSATFQTLNHLLARYISTGSFHNLLIQDPVYQEWDRVAKVYFDAQRSNQTSEEASQGTTKQATRLELPAPDTEEIGERALSARPILDATNGVEHQNKGPEPNVESKVAPSTEVPQKEDKNWRTVAWGCLRIFVVHVLLGPLLYAWHIWLERLFPSRRSARQSNDNAYQRSDKKDADVTYADDTREEQVIQKWLRQGKIQRASLSWPNTIAKWALHWTIGWYWMDNAYELLLALLQRKSPSKFTLVPTKYVLYYWLTQRLTAPPLCTMLAFVLVPAPKRLPFLSGATLLWNSFLASLLYLLAPRVIRMKYVQEALYNMTDNIKSQSTDIPHSLDEL